MDDLTREIFELKFKDAFREKKANEFEDFFSTVMEKCHPADFQRVRPWGNVGDRKNDGYLKSERILFQVYAPNELKAADAVAKIEEDFTGALPHWEEYFETWVFVHNAKGGLGPDVFKKLLDLDKAHAGISIQHWGFEELRKKIFSLPQQELVSLFGAVPSRVDLLNVGLETLAPILDQLAVLPPPTKPDLRPPPSNKIELNALSVHVATLLRTGMSRADLLKKIFRTQPGKRDEIAASFQAHYQQLRGQGLMPDDIFSHLQRYAGGLQQSVTTQVGVLVVLAFFFEECDIFERQAAGGTNDSSD